MMKRFSSPLDALRAAALLHDVGKPASWARGAKWSEHIFDTFEAVRRLLGEEAAWKAMRHHTGSSYDEKYHPRTHDEWIIWLADKMSSGLDRKEDAQDYSWRPSPPITLSHPLSTGRKELHGYGSHELSKHSAALLDSLEESLNSGAEPYMEIYKRLSNSFLRRVPADTRAPVNDVSLWLHSKLTAAISTCIHVDGGWRGPNRAQYRFTLLSGDGDHISRYISESRRLPDLNARSRRVMEATRQAAEAVTEKAGPECVIFAGGGSLLALVPVSLSEELIEACGERFSEAMKGVCTMTLTAVKADGDRLLRDFGEAWAEAGARLRDAKLDKPLYLGPSLPMGRLCDVCGVREAVHEDSQRVLPVNASPRPEALCGECWEARQEGQGVWMEDIEDEAGYIAFIKADGDNMGEALRGKHFTDAGKHTTPGRLSSLSELINTSCEINLRQVVEAYGGRVVYAGGDDLLAVLPGGKALDAAIDLAHGFREAMNGALTMSAGVALCPSRLPVYTALQRVYELIADSKSVPDKNSVSFTVINGLGVEQKPVKPMSWSELDQVICTVSYLEDANLSGSQIRRLAYASIREPVKATAMVENLMGRGLVEWREGERLKAMVEEGKMGDAFMLYNLFKGEKSE